MVFLQNFWWFLVLISVMILVHELGHYWVARLFDVKVETFSIGFGPRLFGFRKGETDFRFCAVLFGGYVKMAGEQPGEDVSSDPRALTAKPRWQRISVAFAGPAINIVLAIAILAGLFMVRYPKIPTPRDPVVGYVMPDGAAAKAGIHEGDQVVQIQDVVDPTWDDISLKEIASPGHPLQVWVKRAGQRLHFTLTPAYDEKDGVGNAGWNQKTQVEIAGFMSGVDLAKKAGLEIGDVLISANGKPLLSTMSLREIEDQANGGPLDLVYSRHGQLFHTTITPERRTVDGEQRWMIGTLIQMRLDVVALPWNQALAESWKQNLQNAKLVVTFLKSIVERRMSPKSLAGPIGIAELSGEAARAGPATFLGLMAAVSLQLAIFNLLPVPVLDGGVMLMLAIEMLLRRDLDQKVREAVLRIGIVFLMMVVVFVIYNDIAKILPGG
jgi:regulator of sigma E protease